MNGRWFTPATVGVKLAEVASSSWLSSELRTVISWQSPTVFTDVSRVTARQSVVIGLVRLSIHASGQSSSMSRAMLEEHRDVAQRADDAARSRRVSPTDCLMPYRSGTSRSWRMESKPPVEMFTTT